MNISRRTALVSGSAFAFSASLPNAALAFPAWQARHGMSGAQYQAMFDSMTAQGYRPIAVDGYNVGGAVTYAAIWMQRGGPAWLARHGMSGADYQQVFDTSTAQGYRPVWISAYPGPSGVLYAAIFDKSSVPAWAARHGLTPAQYQAAFDQFTAQGFHPICVSAVDAGGGQILMAALWEKTPSSAWVARHGLNSMQYQQAFNDFTAQGYRLRQIKGYGPPGGQLFAAIWDKNGGGAWEAHHNMTAAQYQAKFDQMAASGFWVSDVTGYDMGGQAGYAALWEKA